MPETTVVSGATETAPVTAEPSSASTQTTPTEGAEPVEQTAAPKTAAEKKRLRDLIKEDPELAAEYNAEVQKANAKAQKRWERQQLKLDAKAAVDADDPEAAIGIARHVATEPDDDDETPDPTAGARKAAALNADKAFLADPDYAELFNSDGGKDTIQKLFKEIADPDALKTRLRAEGRRLAIKREVRDAIKASLPDIQKAAHEEAVNTTLKDLPVPLSGNAGVAGGVTLDRYNSDQGLRRKLQSTPEGRKQIDDMMARAAAGR